MNDRFINGVDRTRPDEVASQQCRPAWRTVSGGMFEKNTETGEVRLSRRSIREEAQESFELNRSLR